MMNRLITLPLVICQVWPQYRILRILYFGLIKKSNQWKKENEHLKKDVSCLGNPEIVVFKWFAICYFLIFVLLSEPFLEAVPQIHCLLVILVLDELVAYGANHTLFIVTFSSSVLTASLGIAKFLKTGPCRLVPDQGPMGGHATLGFFLLMVNIALTIVGKGFMLPAIGYGPESSRLFQSTPTAIGVWIAICYIPQLLYVSSNSRKVKLLSINKF